MIQLVTPSSVGLPLTERCFYEYACFDACANPSLIPLPLGQYFKNVEAAKTTTHTAHVRGLRQLYKRIIESYIFKPEKPNGARENIVVLKKRSGSLDQTRYSKEEPKGCVDPSFPFSDALAPSTITPEQTTLRLPSAHSALNVEVNQSTEETEQMLQKKKPFQQTLAADIGQVKPSVTPEWTPDKRLRTSSIGTLNISPQLSLDKQGGGPAVEAAPSFYEDVDLNSDIGTLPSTKTEDEVKARRRGLFSGSVIAHIVPTGTSKKQTKLFLAGCAYRERSSASSTQEWNENCLPQPATSLQRKNKRKHFWSLCRGTKGIERQASCDVASSEDFILEELTALDALPPIIYCSSRTSVALKKKIQNGKQKNLFRLNILHSMMSWWLGEDVKTLQPSRGIKRSTPQSSKSLQNSEIAVWPSNPTPPVTETPGLRLLSTGNTEEQRDERVTPSWNVLDTIPSASLKALYGAVQAGLVTAANEKSLWLDGLYRLLYTSDQRLDPNDASRMAALKGQALHHCINVLQLASSLVPSDRLNMKAMESTDADYAQPHLTYTCLLLLQELCLSPSGIATFAELNGPRVLIQRLSTMKPYFTENDTVFSGQKRMLAELSFLTTLKMECLKATYRLLFATCIPENDCGDTWIEAGIVEFPMFVLSKWLLNRCFTPDGADDLAHRGLALGVLRVLSSRAAMTNETLRECAFLALHHLHQPLQDAWATENALAILAIAQARLAPMLTQELSNTMHIQVWELVTERSFQFNKDFHVLHQGLTALKEACLSDSQTLATRLYAANIQKLIRSLWQQQPDGAALDCLLPALTAINSVIETMSSTKENVIASFNASDYQYTFCSDASSSYEGLPVAKENCSDFDQHHSRSMTAANDSAFANTDLLYLEEAKDCDTTTMPQPATAVLTTEDQTPISQFYSQASDSQFEEHSGFLSEKQHFVESQSSNNGNLTETNSMHGVLDISTDVSTSLMQDFSELTKHSMAPPETVSESKSWPSPSNRCQRNSHGLSRKKSKRRLRQ